MFNLPNVLTVLRILLVPCYMFVLYSDILYANQIACFLFAVSAFTDLLDGYIARKYRLVTNLGKVLDPVADKIMVAAAMVVLVDLQLLPAWVVVLMLFRDFSVGALRDIAAQQGTIIAAGVWGKLKTVLQMIALGFIIFKDSLVIWPPKFISVLVEPFTTTYQGAIIIPALAIGNILIYIALAASVFSGLLYFIEFRKVIAKQIS